MSRASKPRQANLFAHKEFRAHNRREHGGALAQGRRKLYRPLDPKRPVHLVLRSSRATGKWSMLHPENVFKVKALLKKWSAHFDVKVYGFANSGNHLHLIVKARTRNGFQDFLRTFSALTARLITKARKGAALAKNKEKLRFWDALAFSRIVTWGRDLIATQRYLLRNKLEAVGFMTKQDRLVTFAEALADRGIILKT